MTTLTCLHVLTLTATVGAALVGVGTASATARSGDAASAATGTVVLLDFAGEWESDPGPGGETGPAASEASVWCTSRAGTRTAVFAGAAVQGRQVATAQRRSGSKTVQFAQLTATAVGADGSPVVGGSSAPVRVAAGRLTTLPSVSVKLPPVSQRYAPVLQVRWLDDRLRLVGTRRIAPRVVATQVTTTQPPYETWTVTTAATVTCP